MPHAHVPALRLALRSMLADVTYDVPEREWIARLLDMAPWSDEAVHALTVVALRWVSTQRGDVRAAMRKALGEEVSKQEEAMLPSHARLDSTRYALTTSLEGDAPVTIAELTEQHNGTLVIPKDSAVSELYGEPDWTELERQARLMRSAPWDEPQERLDKAVNAIKAGRVSLGVPATSLAYVKSEDDKRTYTVRETGCTCRATRPCYHLTSAELYRLWQDKITPPSLFATPRTVDERLAETPPNSHEETSRMASEAQDDPADVPASETPLAAPEHPQAPLGEAEAFLVASPARVCPPVLPKGLGLRPITAIVADLSRPLPSLCVAQKTVKGTTIPYLHWQTVARLLDTYAPGWQGEVTRLETHGATLRVTYRLHLPCAEGVVWREATGEDDEWEATEETRYGNPSANAQANAFKRAAALFGCGQWLYDKAGDLTAQALAEHVRQEKTEAVIALGKALLAKGMDRQQAGAWLKQQSGVTKMEEIPLAALRTMLAYVAQQDETLFANA